MPRQGDTIYALSSGSPPAAVALIRISGPGADAALQHLVGFLPEPRRAAVAALLDPASGELLDKSLILRFPGPRSTTGEDVVELHLHGGRAVLASVLEALARMPGLRAAEPGEFTRRAFEHGRIDLAEAEGLADLLLAETQSQRRAALAMAGGSVSRLVAGWQSRLIGLAARLEAAFDFSDEAEIGERMPASWRDALAALAGEIRATIGRPVVERLHDGLHIVVAGPPNAGKSSLFNALVGREAAITSAAPGTTRDLIEAPVAIDGLALLVIDTAGLRESGDAVEAIGVRRAMESLAAADLILWLGPPAACPDRRRSIIVHSKSDLGARPAPGVEVSVSAVTGDGMGALTELLRERVAGLLPQEGDVALNRRHAKLLADVLENLESALPSDDLLIGAEGLRQARTGFDRITGKAGVEDVLDTLFSRFCVGK